MERAIIIDIDGVILDTGEILREIYDLKLKGDNLWNYFYEHCNSSKAIFIRSIIPLLSCLQNNVHILVSTARNERVRKETENRLKLEGIPYDLIYMRDDGDYRTSSEVKKDHINQIQRKYKIIAFIDDDLTNCQMARDKGILALRKV